MSKRNIVDNMVKFIEDEEKDLQAQTLFNFSKVGKTDIVSKILKELEKKVQDENTKD